MSTKTIKITCDVNTFAPLEDLSNFQGDLKTITDQELEKLKKSIIQYGFSFPIFMWQLNILDGHQRIEAVKSLIKDGWELEHDRLPVVSINAKDRKEAAEKLLLINSRYAKIDQAGFDIFVDEFEINIEDFSVLLEIPDIEFDFNGAEKNKTPDDFKNVDETDLKNTCPKCGYEFD